MKKQTLSVIMIVLLAACQPAITPTEPPTAIPHPLPTPVSTSAPTPVPTPVITETLADSVRLVQGLWFNPSHGGLTMSINGGSESSSLTYSVYEMAGFYLVSQGTAKFEDGKFTYLTDDYHCINSAEAAYEIYIIKEDGFITGMRQQLDGSDACADRLDANGFVYHYSGLAALPAGIERPPKTGGEVFGLWYSETGLLLDYHLGRIDVKTGNADIAFTLHWTRADPWMQMGTGTAKYENGKFSFLTGEGACEGNAEATYEISLIVRNDKVIGMHPQVVGDDPCADRKDALNNRIIRRVNP
ncbi:MAG: hypothetical protein HY864_01780 [Chloroflexi bacterium]|nr:hypothetical protein [Chloroflexota bacterium]